MTAEPDPYRTLGLARGASLDEVKRAYRRLAKINHPDVAGEAALPRFLAIRAAYERLVGGSTAPTNGRRAPATPRRAWEADRDQADATRRAYGGRAGGPSSPPGPDGSSSAGPAGARAGSWTGRPDREGPTSPGSRPRGPGSGTREPSGRSRRRPTGPRPGPTAGAPGSGKSRPPNKATPGSTSYDGADAGPFEPDWGGASWYGTTSGTYWTLNPKEYADPRKHGPEYQARARRASRSRPPATGTSGEERDAPAEEGPTVEAVGDVPPATTADATHTTSTWWASTAGPTEDPAAVPPTGRDMPPDRRTTAAGVEPPLPPPDLGRAAAEFGRALTDTGYGGLRGRVVRALIGWLPIALGLGWLVGELTGCGRFSATCDPATDPILLGLQLAILGLLLAIPVVASVATMAALTLLLASIGAAFVLSATGAAADSDSRRTALGVVLVCAWLLGLAIAVLRRAHTLPSRASPVS